MSTTTRNLWVVLAAVLTAAAASSGCGGDESGGTGVVDDAGNTSGSDADGTSGGGDAGDTDADTATGGDDINDGLLGLGEFCVGSEDCRSNLCFQLEGSDRGFCSQFCLRPTDCPGSGFDCIFVQNQSDEIARVCVPLDFCIDEDQDRYGVGPGCISRDCDDNNPDRNPGVIEVCDNIDNDCDGQVDDDPVDANVTCSTGIPGVCSEGLLQCLFGELTCETVRFASSEVCDNIDNDCDGLTDEDEDGDPLSEPCYSGPPGTAGVGRCTTGARVCTSGQFSICLGEALPLIELCDGIDNDCDGQTDDGMPETGLDCNTEAQGACRQGQTLCNAEGDIVCVGVVTPVDEMCDGVDNDCDGNIDEDDGGDPMTRPCYDGPPGTEDKGICTGGVQTCADGVFGVCAGQVLPRDELCDDFDNDCDDALNEGNPAGGQLCSTALLGQCNEGETVCGDEGLMCRPLRMPSDEVCDNKDNDCDGQVDEGTDGPLTQTCYTGPEGTVGQGFCHEGTRTCVGGVFTSCQGQVLPETEVCDGEDNDCDGQVDNSPQGAGSDCPTGLRGACGVGRNACRDGALVCEPAVEPQPEVCNGLDDDCDGRTDEDANDPDQLLRQVCYNGPAGTAGVGQCRSGMQTCTGGRFSSCVGETRPARVELCNGNDDDCDGDVDEDNPGSGFACSVPNVAGACSNGVTACSNAQIICIQQNQPQDETCNGRDDDCDGDVDEGADGQPLRQMCYDGPAGTSGRGTCRTGARVCTGGVFTSCQGQVLPTDDLCNDGLDNDCNGTPDDGDPQEGQVCSTGLGGICAQGVKACQNNTIVCRSVNQPMQAEVCNGLDDDCDGGVDEGTGGQPLSQTCYGGPAGTSGRGICRSGTQTCQGGQYTSCQGQVLPQTELCDNIDNDCSGVADDHLTPEEVNVACTTESPGICAPGRTACQNGAIVCSATSAPMSEMCDGVDNDCDGNLDNGFAGLGNTCFSGQGVCMRPGVLVCNPANRAGAPICNAQAGTGNANELCDYLDDDCDGQVDEPFTNASGVYNSVANCGGCGVNCNNRWPGGPAMFNVAPACRVVGSSAGCGFDCTGGYVDIDLVPDNGCEFLPDAGAIYVSTPANGGNNTGACGAYNAPCATITFAITRAQQAGRPRVRVSSGQYRENVTLVAGINILGGHNPSNWTRTPAIFVTAIIGSTPSPSPTADRMAVTATNITTATEFSGFTVNAENAGAGGNSVGIYVLNSTSALVIRDNVVFGGTGGNGTAGTSGRSGNSGTQNGGTGQTSQVCNATASCARSGGTGGVLVCDNPSGVGTTTVSGGQGGTSTRPSATGRCNGNSCPVVTCTASSQCAAGQTCVSGQCIPIQFSGTGVTGSSTNGGPGGAGAANALGTFDGQVFNCDFGGNAEPVPGTTGTTGTNGTGGSASSLDEGAFNSAFLQWRGNKGGNGNPGQHGGGGGGGGAAAGVDALDINQNGVLDSGAQNYWGAAGGGGGSGGCAGFAGVGGNAGGGSFAIAIGFSAGSAPTNAGQMPTLTNNILIRGQGGQGGRGGDGGAGGDPSQGGIGGDGLENTGDNFDFCLADGAVGGKGGRGGHAGGGAGGNGGVSFDIYIGNNTNNINPNYSSNVFVLNDNIDTAGRGGNGGSSSNATNGRGGTGTLGASGNILTGP